MKALAWVLSRIEEPSTWAGAGIVAFALGSVGVAPNVVQASLAVGSAIGGLLAIIIPEKSA